MHRLNDRLSVPHPVFMLATFCASEEHLQANYSAAHKNRRWDLGILAFIPFFPNKQLLEGFFFFKYKTKKHYPLHDFEWQE